MTKVTTRPKICENIEIAIGSTLLDTRILMKFCIHMNTDLRTRFSQRNCQMPLDIDRDNAKSKSLTVKMAVCGEVLRPSQPNGVMSSMISLPNHTFTGQA